MKKIWGYVHLFKALLIIVLNPQNTSAALSVGEWLYRLGLTQHFIQKLESQPNSLELIKARKLLAPYDLTELEKRPVGSLGRSYAEHMMRNHLRPDFYKILDTREVSTFCMMRLRQTHDLWHVLTGFGTSVPEELGLQAFLHAQTETPLPAVLMGGALVRAGLKDPSMVRIILEQIVLGYRLGTQAKNIFALDWESHWQTPLDQLRQEFHIDSKLISSDFKNFNKNQPGLLS